MYGSDQNTTNFISSEPEGGKFRSHTFTIMQSFCLKTSSNKNNNNNNNNNSWEIQC